MGLRYSRTAFLALGLVEAHGSANVIDSNVLFCSFFNLLVKDVSLDTEVGMDG